MSLTAKDVAEISRLLDESVFDELYLEFNGVKLSLRRGAAARGDRDASARIIAAATSGIGAGSTADAAPAAARAAAPAGVDAVSADAAVHDVPAPLLGTFYRAPKPGAPPFVEVGSDVDEETVIGIIEVMKLMNSVRAGARGRITDIFGRDGVLVEYGETLMRVAKAD